MSAIEIVYYSGEGHTALQADEIAQGARARLWRLDETGEVPGEMWSALDDADAILFGSPTFMGGPAWQFKRFADETGERWYNRRWQGKLAGGFTTSGSTNGDKGECLSYFMTLANQHGMIWISLGQVSPPSLATTPEQINWSGGNAGPMAAGLDRKLPAGDLASARAYGARVAQIAARFS